MNAGASSADPLAPSARDLHLIGLRDEVLPLLKDQRLTAPELLRDGRAKRPKLFNALDLELFWRVLTYTELARYSTHSAAPTEAPQAWTWDLTPEGETQISLYAILTKRAKYGGILGLSAAVVGGTLLCLDAGIVTVVVVGALVLFACFMATMWVIFRWLMLYAIDAVREREAEVQRARESAAMQPWWPPLDSDET